MSNIIQNLPADRHVYQGNLCVIRNDLRNILWQEVFEENTDDFESYSKENFEENLEQCRLSIDKGKKYSSTLEGLETTALYTGIFWNKSLLLGLLFKLASLTGREGSDLKIEVFERGRFGNKDNHNLRELYFRDIYNQSLMKSSFMSSIIVLSFLREVSIPIYELTLGGLEVQVKEGRRAAASYVLSEVRD